MPKFEVRIARPDFVFEVEADNEDFANEEAWQKLLDTNTAGCYITETYELS
jgi:hypothetical protein